MLAVEGIYQDNQLILNEKISFSEPVRVIVTFLDEPQKEQCYCEINEFLPSFRSRTTLKILEGTF